MDKLSASPEELKKKIKELEERNRYLENILDTIPVIIFAKDKNSKYSYTNKACDDMNGHGRGWLIGKYDIDRNVPQELVQDYQANDSLIMETRQESRQFSPLYTQSEVQYYNVIKDPLINDAGEAIGVLGIALPDDRSTIIPGMQTPDSTDGVLEDCDSLFFDYCIETGNCYILRTLENFDIFAQNTNLIEDGKKRGTIFPDDILQLKECFDLMNIGEEQASALVRFYDNDKQLRWCKLLISCVYDHHMKPIRALGTITPLSESVVEKEQKDLEIESVTNRIMNILGKRYEAFIYLNEKENFYQILFGTGIYKTIPRSGSLDDYHNFCSLYLHDGDYDEAMIPQKPENDREYIVGEELHAQEIRMKTVDGSYRWKEVAYFPLKAGHSNGILVTVSDVNDTVRKRQDQRLKEINNEIIDILSTVVEFRSVESGDHIQRIKGFTKIMLKYVNEMFDDVDYPPELIDVISSASAMHDIGKIAIPDSILLKPGKLTAEEFDEMKKHTTKGCDILKSMENIQDERYYKYSYEICRYHHERYDGRGYPEGLKGDDIPLAAQIVSVADVYDALISKRVYKDAYSLDEAFQMILNGECGVFSPRLMECFKCAKEEMESFSLAQIT